MSVTKLPAPAEVVLQCLDCGCQTFYLHPDGPAECGNCHSRETGLQSGWRPKGTPAYLPRETKPSKAEHAPSRLLQLGTSEAARRSVASRITSEDIRGCCVVRKDGTITAWFEHHIQSKAQRKWWKRKAKGWLQMMELPKAKVGKPG